MEDEVFYTPGNMPNFDALRPSKRTEIKHQVKEAQKQRKKRSRLMRRLAKKAKKEGGGKAQEEPKKGEGKVDEKAKKDAGGKEEVKVKQEPGEGKTEEVKKEGGAEGDEKVKEEEKRNFVGADGNKEPLDHDAFIAKWKAESPDAVGGLLTAVEELDKAAQRRGTTRR